MIFFNKNVLLKLMKSISDSLMADNLINFLAKVPKRPIEQSENKNTISEEEKEN